MGQSAGSWGIIHQLLNPQSAGLFTGAIAESGTPLGKLSNRYRTAEEDEAWGTRYFK